MADAILSLAVHARFARGHHSRQNRLVEKVLAHTLRTLVHTEHVAHAVTGAMTIVSVVLPQRHAGQHVKLASTGTTGE